MLVRVMILVNSFSQQMGRKQPEMRFEGSEINDIFLLL